ncbi:MAG: cytochrome c [Crocinitomicaceae bacterium]|nr:cytochrome c [Crocinitomicaceae bacterium]
MKNSTWNFIVLSTLIGIFIAYSCYLYFGKGTSSSSAPHMSNLAIEGEQIWQNNNCTACHQLYGLGGYLGPDLTNVISNPQKGEIYARSFLNSGVKSMPKFDFTEQEKDALIAFFAHVDATGYYPNQYAEFSKDGWVKIKYK